MKGEETRGLKRLRHMVTAGNLWLYVLSLLKGRKMYAYALPGSIERKFGFRPGRVMIYVVLYKLEDEGLIRSQFEERRKYYHITPMGRKALAGGRKCLMEVAGGL